MKKRLITFVTTVIFILSLSACGSGDSGSGTGFLPQNQPKSTQALGITPIPNQQQPTQEPVTDAETPEDGDLKQTSADITLTYPTYGEIHIKSFAVTKNHYNEDILVLWADYTNFEDDSNSSAVVLNHLEIFQDDIKIYPENNFHTSEVSTIIRPNKTIEITFAYALRDTTNDVYFELVRSNEILDTDVLTIK